MAIQELVSEVAGGAAIFGGIAGILGTVITNYLHERSKTYQRIIQRNSDAQFKLYNSLWCGLQDLKVVADQLWERATMETFHKFVKAVFEARLSTEKGRLLIAEDDYRELDRLLKSFEDFQLGKRKLIEMRSRQEVVEDYQGQPEDEIRRVIDNNRVHKVAYEEKITSLAISLRRSIGVVR